VFPRHQLLYPWSVVSVWIALGTQFDFKQKEVVHAKA
jgi:hypothetical protein